MRLADIQALLAGPLREALKLEAFRRFGAEPEEAEELEGSAAVYRCQAGGRAIALKIAPGFALGHPAVAGSTLDQVLAEVDFVAALAEAGLPVAAPVPSPAGDFVEVLPGPEGAAFFAYATEFLPGELLPDDDVMVFPPGLVEAWGKALGGIHAFSAAWSPRPGRRRLSWLENDLLDAEWFGEGAVAAERERLLRASDALPRDARHQGLCHGDPHHGNFMWEGGGLVFFDFDACRYAPWLDDIQAALYNCLPMPREAVAARRAFALDFLRDFLRGYRQAHPLPAEDLAALPLLLKLGELSSYGYCLKYWRGEELTPRRREILAIYESRLAAGLPVVAFEEGDLDL